MKGVFSVLNNIYNRCVDYFFYLAGALVISMLLVIVIDVTLRYVFRSSIVWGFEFTEYALIYITFLGTAWLLKHGDHVKMDILLVSLKPGAQAWLVFIASGLLVIACILLLWYGINSTLDAIQTNAMSVKYYSIPKFILLIIIPISSFLLLIQALKNIAAGYRSLRAPSKIPTN